MVVDHGGDSGLSNEKSDVSLHWGEDQDCMLPYQFVRELEDAGGHKPKPLLQTLHPHISYQPSSSFVPEPSLNCA